MRWMLWHPRSSDLTPCDFFLRGNMKCRMFVPQMPGNIADVKKLIDAAVNMLLRVWQELYCHVNVYHVPVVHSLNIIIWYKNC